MSLCHRCGNTQLQHVFKCYGYFGGIKPSTAIQEVVQKRPSTHLRFETELWCTVIRLMSSTNQFTLIIDVESKTRYMYIIYHYFQMQVIITRKAYSTAEFSSVGIPRKHKVISKHLNCILVVVWMVSLEYPYCHIISSLLLYTLKKININNGLAEFERDYFCWSSHLQIWFPLNRWWKYFVQSKTF